MEPTRVGQRMLVEVGGAVIQVDVTLLSQTPHGLQMAASADVPMTGNRLFNRLPPEIRAKIWYYVFHVDEGIVPIILDSELRDDLSPSRNARIPYHDDEYLQNTFILNLNHTDANATARRNLSLATQLVKTCRLFWNDLKFFKTMYRHNTFVFSSRYMALHYIAAITPDRRQALRTIRLCNFYYSRRNLEQHLELLAVLGQCHRLQVVHIRHFWVDADDHAEAEELVAEVAASLVYTVRDLRVLTMRGHAEFFFDPSDDFEEGVTFDLYYKIKEDGYNFSWTEEGSDVQELPSRRGERHLEVAWETFKKRRDLHHEVDEEFLQSANRKTGLIYLGEERHDRLVRIELHPHIYGRQ
ncbi:hypothetical protein VFPFJ_01337 [Purpureocillium lilacinum]|uniref:DUF7730 domain-containing protein n=1 Tax=Purpureocillium lilacinum TaxID=33203 RepID=A0A179HAS9_PURLI|nr:hypothetical protein VFPFJ_01337 [Purpureocillium lilacinum]KAK4092698.1 hypothetical protein Purlil1_2623 [Purpureocillium lilacinum]OAQ87277.1 hypothetical protein VFPBJ_01317 [Purpureocillium lilacinum]OAQ95228.1 hypothetical protein VFPFJ_01337 [Purpureocillium lilacinum]